MARFFFLDLNVGCAESRPVLVALSRPHDMISPAVTSLRDVIFALHVTIRLISRFIIGSIDRIIGINFNLFDETPEIIIEGKTYSYESALVDVGSKIHSIVTKEKPRLVLKYAIRNSWNEVYDILDKRGLINHTKTYLENPNYLYYESILKDCDRQFIK